MRIGAMEMLAEAQAAGALDRPIDAVFATSLLSLADLIAGLPPPLRGTPTILYMHENQVAYPRGHEPGDGGGGEVSAGESGAIDAAGDRAGDLDAPSETRASSTSGGGNSVGDNSVGDNSVGDNSVGDNSGGRDVHFALTNLTSVLSADRVIFNSEWNRRSFIEGIGHLLAHAPDGRLGDVAARIARRSEVIWPPVEPPPPPEGKEPEGIGGRSADPGNERGVVERGGVLHKPVRVVWPHRWEHDKGPDELLDIADRYSEKLNIRWTILGQRFRGYPPAFAEFRRRWADRIDQIGFEPDRRAYWRHLHRCDWVLSTARHEFFGIAVVEAMLAGCLPWLPDRLSYVELLPKEARGLRPPAPPAPPAPPVPPADPEKLRRAVQAHLEPALAPNAVARLDEAITSVVAAR